MTVDPFKPDLPDGPVVPAVEAVDWSGNSDIRPRIWDNSAGQFRLIDSRSMITATQRLPGDKPDNRLRLMAVNGSEIKTYGIRELKIKIGQKEYKMPAVICDVGQDILGADFINKYKLGIEWDDFDQTELFLSDKIKSSPVICNRPIKYTKNCLPGARDQVGAAGGVAKKVVLTQSRDKQCCNRISSGMHGEA